MGKIYNYLAEDHVRLDDALLRTMKNPDAVDMAPYAEFRAGLLRHISMEEKILLPAARAANEGKPLSAAGRLHLDHGALAALLVPTPTPSIMKVVKTILDAHNPVEEGSGGIYDECERLIGAEVDDVLTRLQNARPVLLAPLVDSPIAFASARTALQKAGYDLDF